MAKQTKTENTQAVAAYDWSKPTEVTGLEHARAEDFGIPFLAVLQSGSPQIKKTDPAYATKKIEGAGEGDIIQNISNRVLYSQGKEPLQFIPCSFEKCWVEWTPRTKGGGIIRMHRNAMVLSDTKKNDRGQDELPNGNLIVTTAYFSGLALIDGEWQPAIIGMSSTQLKKSRQWLNTMTSLKINGVNPPAFSHIYNITTVPESNQEGSWFGWKVEVRGVSQDTEVITKSIELAKRAADTRPALPAGNPENY
jgi:hypothetical protein